MAAPASGDDVQSPNSCAHAAQHVAALAHRLDELDDWLELVDGDLRTAYGMSGQQLVTLAREARALARAEGPTSDTTQRRLRRLIGARINKVELSRLVRVGVGHVANLTPAKGAHEILLLHSDGRTPAEIMKETGRSRQYVYRVLADSGERPNKPRPDAARRTRDALVVRLYRGGAAIKAITAESGCDKSTVINILRKAHREGRCPEYGARNAEVQETFRRRRESGHW